MNFLNPAFLYLFFLLPILFLLYILRLRRRTHVVSSCLLWEQAIEDIKANTPFQKLRKNLLLPLQFIFLALAIFALARPFFRSAASLSQNTILVIDGSASMKAKDLGETRFEAAKSAAIKMVDNLSKGDKMMIIEALSSPQVISGFTSDKLKLREAIDSMMASDSRADMGRTLELAWSLAENETGGEIFLLSDGASVLTDEFSSSVLKTHFIGFGKQDADNMGIVAFELGRSPANESQKQIFVSLQNFGNTARNSLLLELYHDDNLVDVREFNLAPGERRSFIFDEIEYTEGVMRVSVDTEDDLHVDNQAYYVLRDLDRLRLLLVSPGNLFLEEAVRTTSLGIELSVESDETYSADATHHITIFDGFIPGNLPDGNIMIVNPVTHLPFGKLITCEDNPSVIDWDRSHPVTRFVDFSNIMISRMCSYEMPEWMKPLLESDMGTLIWLGEDDGRRILVLTFAIQLLPTSNFPMLSAFPIFISNALKWLSGSDPDSSQRQLKAGEPIKLSLPEGINELLIKTPHGERMELQAVNRELVFTNTLKTGVYDITGDGFSEKFAVNLLDESESDIKPADKIQIADKEITSSRISTVSNREIWGILIFVAIILLGIEWWAYHRRILV
jgi:hypothetical protein